MIGVIVEVILAVIILLYCLYSGFFISIMANTPFIELVYEFFEKVDRINEMYPYLPEAE